MYLLLCPDLQPGAATVGRDLPGRTDEVPHLQPFIQRSGEFLGIIFPDHQRDHALVRTYVHHRGLAIQVVEFLDVHDLITEGVVIAKMLFGFGDINSVGDEDPFGLGGGCGKKTEGKK